MANPRVKVRVVDLMSAVAARREQVVKDHEKSVARWEKDKATYSDRAVAALLKAAEEGKKGRFPEKERYGERLMIPGYPAYVGAKPVLNTQRVDRDYNLLKLSADEFINVATDNEWKDYL